MTIMVVVVVISSKRSERIGNVRSAGSNPHIPLQKIYNDVSTSDPEFSILCTMFRKLVLQILDVRLFISSSSLLASILYTKALFRRKLFASPVYVLVCCMRDIPESKLRQWLRITLQLISW